MSRKYFSILVAILLLAVCIIPERANAEQFVTLVSHDDNGETVVVRINSILVGRSPGEAGVMHEHEFGEALKMDKKVIYMNVSVTNDKFNGDFNVWPLSFRLIDTKGNVSVGEVTKHHIQGSISKGRTVRGGVCFKPYSDSIPERLELNTGLVDKRSKKELVPYIPNLSIVPIFCR